MGLGSLSMPEFDSRSRRDLRTPDVSEPNLTQKSDLPNSNIESLLAITNLIIDGSSVPDLFQSLVPLLQKLAGCDFVSLARCDETQSGIITDFWNKGTEVGLGRTFTVKDSPCGWVWENQQTMTIPDLELETRFPATFAEIRALGIHSLMFLPMRTKTERFGTLGFGKASAEIWSNDTLNLLSGVTRMVALALENRKARSLADERQERLKNLLAISDELNSSLDFDRLLPIVFAHLRYITNCDWAVIALWQDDREKMRLRGNIWEPQFEPLLGTGLREIALADAISAQSIRTRTIAHWNPEDLQRFGGATAQAMLTTGTKSACNLPLIAQGDVLGALIVGSARKEAFTRIDTGYLQQVANLFATAIRNSRDYSETKRLQDRWPDEKRYLEKQIREERKFDDIVGNSPSLKRVMDNAVIVACTDATVLISGETGTGKERVARAIHALSPRKDRAFVKLNCAAIPTGLLESELFGHEKGAFTGAVSQKVGRLELADKGTLLLDEVGEIPLELQPKLLRVLQDQEFERLGGTKTIRVEVRLIAATNKDLIAAVEDHEFRSDLFYRLNVFPLHLPPLRERREDIPLLVRYFVEKCSARLHKQIDLISDEVIEAMMNWSWPGNIRELENFIERSVILSDENYLHAPLAELRGGGTRHSSDAEETLRERERNHIVEILRQTHGVLSGATGASGRLGLKRTTLQYKMQKLGISRADYLD
jgi:formate hydrogenlyase transcriptional activator